MYYSFLNFPFANHLIELTQHVICNNGFHDILDGIIVPVLVHNPLDDAAKFHNVSNQTLMWQGNLLVTIYVQLQCCKFQLR